MPSIGTGANGGYNSFGSKLSLGNQSPGALSTEQRESLTKGIFNTTYSENRGMGSMEKTASWAAASAIDLADSIWAAPVIPGTERGDVWDFYKDYGPFGDELKDFYTRNQSGVEMLSGITGAVGTGYLAGALLLPRLTNAMASSTAISGSAIWQAGARANAAVRARMFDAQTQAALAGESANVFSSARMGYLGWQGTKGVGVAAFEEAAIVGVMGSNKAVWSDEMSENLIFGALGLGIGGSLNMLAARAEMRRIANSGDMTKVRADSIDPQGITFMRERFEGDSQLLARAAKENPAKKSASLTAMLLESRQANPAGMGEAAIQNLDAYRIQMRNRAQMEFQAIGSKGITGVSNTRFKVDTSVGEHFNLAAKNDPLAFAELDSIGVISRQKTSDLVPIELPDPAPASRSVAAARTDFESFGGNPGIIEKRAAVIQQKHGVDGFNEYQRELSRLKKKTDKLKKDMEAARQQQTPLEAAMFAHRSNAQSLKLSDKADEIREGYRLEKQQPLVMVNGAWMPAATKEAAELSTYVPNQVKITQPIKGQGIYKFQTSLGREIRIDESFGVKNFHALSLSERLEVTEAMSQVFAQFKRSGAPHVVSSKPDWFQLDAAIHFEKTGGKVDWSKSGINGVEAAEVESLKRKSVYLEDKGAGGYWDRLRFNLPLPSAVERIQDPAGDMFAAVLKAAADGAGYAEIKALRAQLNKVAAFDVQGANDELLGNLFQFNRSEKNEWLEPMLGYFDESPGMKLLDDAMVAEQLAELKAARIASLTSNEDGIGLVPALTKNVIRSPEFQTSLSVRQLSDDQITGVGGFGSQLSGEVLTQEFKNRDNKTLMALQRVREQVNRASDQYLSQLTKVHLGDSVAKLNAAPAAGSKVLVNQWLSNTHGWDIAADAVRLDDGRWGFQLENSAKNQARLGRKIEEDELLTNPRTGAPIALDDLGMQFVDGFQKISKELLRDTNRIRSSMGLEPIKARHWYAPPPDTTGKFIGFTFDEFNQLVPGGGIVANSKAEYDSIVARMTKEYEGTKNTIRSKADVEQTGDIWDDAMMDWLSPTSAVAPVKSSTGALANLYVNPNSVQDSLNWVKKQVEKNGTGLMRSLYDSQLGIVRARSAMQDARSGQELTKIRNIFDVYEGMVLGSSLGDSRKSLTGAVMKPIEGLINTGLETAWPAMRFMSPAQLGKWMGDLQQLTGFKGGSRARNFRQLSEQLGEYTPFKDSQDYIDQTLKIVRPPEVREITQKLNTLSASLILRWMEIPHAAMNIVGIITTMPSILRNGRAPITTFVGEGKGKIGVVDTYRILASSTTDMLRAERRADWEYMKLNGDASQQVADFNIQMASVKDRGSFGRVFMGDPNAKSLVGKKGIDGMLGLITDTSENYSRAWSHFAGLRLADMQGITGMEARHAFAREIANAAIANYNPLNRPELYQSAFGSMFGLFMSWMQSYNQRLFRWMENKDYRAVGRQLAMQSSLFGLASNPGYNQLEAALMATGVTDTPDGREATMVDHLYARFGPELGSTLAHGGLYQLGAVLYPRGDMNYRDVTMDPSRLMAGAGVAQSLVKAMYESVNSTFSSNSLDETGQLAEILARHMPNRAMKGTMAVLLNDGKDVDMNGRVISETKDSVESMLRIIGLRSTRQQAEVEAFYANKQQQQREAARQETFRLSTRALLRNGKLEERLPEIFAKYNELGMRPENFRSWIQSQIREAQGTRGINDLQRALKNPATQQSVWRYNAYGAIQN